jgi:DNA-binding GntR family transcriptional regulator
MADSALAESRLNRKSTAEHVANALREQLLQGRYSPGSRLPEDEIARALGVSRNSVREGLQILASEGLVQRSLHRGAVASELNAADLADVYQARRIIEISSLRAGMRSKNEWQQTIVRAVRDMEQAVAANDLPALLEADRGFHEGITAGSHSQRIARFYRNLQTEIRLTRTWKGERQPPEIFLARHREVADAIEAGDLTRAEELLTKMIDDGERRVRDGLNGLSSEAVEVGGANR